MKVHPFCPEKAIRGDDVSKTSSQNVSFCVPFHERHGPLRLPARGTAGMAHQTVGVHSTQVHKHPIPGVWCAVPYLFLAADFRKYPLVAGAELFLEWRPLSVYRY